MEIGTREGFVAGLCLNLGCGSRKMEGYVNVDKLGEPDFQWDLETFPWSWDDNSVAKIELCHVLEHLGQQTDTYLKIIQELYRVSQPGAVIHVSVPHHRHGDMFHDSTHVRAITPFGLSMFSQRLNREWQTNGNAATPLGLYLNVNFELPETRYIPSELWDEWRPGRTGDAMELLRQSALITALIKLIKAVEMTLMVVK